MTKITENKIELFTIELLEKQGYSYIYAPNIAPDSETPMRESFEDVILKEKLQNSLTAINPTLDYDQIEYAVKQIERLKSTELLTDNEAFHKMLTEGITVEVQKVFTRIHLATHTHKHLASRLLKNILMTF